MVKARLAACGNQQTAGSYGETYASTSDHGTFACVVAAYQAHTQSIGTVVYRPDFDITSFSCRRRIALPAVVALLPTFHLEFTVTMLVVS